MPFSTLPASLAEALIARGYAAPTAVQAAVMEPDAQGRDLIVSAQTGSGKTVAFGIAMAEQLLDADGHAGPSGKPGALIIAPTRELALQVSRELIWLYKDARAWVATCVGGMDASKERRALSHGAHIVVGTPGRLRDHLERGALDLSGLKVAILDEADEMLDMGFRDDLEQILDASPNARRTMLFSATMPRPIVALAKRYQKDALRISTVGEDRGHGDISYQAVTVAPSDIENAVVNLLRLHEPDTAILFCATRDAVRHLHANLVDRGFSAVALSGEHSQSERNNALQALRDKRARVCVATDVAARGLDLPSLSLVVHVELPRDAEALQHRSGRTGRAGRKIGIAEASMHLASLVATHFSIVTTLTRTIVIAEHLALTYGMERICRRVRAIDVAVLDLHDPASGAAGRLLAECRPALDEDGSGAIVLGCAGMADLAADLSSKLSVPVIESVSAAVKLAEALAGLGISTSKRGDYAVPLTKAFRT